MRDLQKTFYLRLMAVLILLSIIQLPDPIYAQSAKDWSVEFQTLSVGQGVIRYEYNVDQSMELSLVDIAKEKWYRCTYVFVEGDGTFGIDQDGTPLSEEFPGSIVFEGGYNTNIHIQKGGKLLQSKVLISIELIEPEVENINKMAILSVNPYVPTDILVNDVFIGGDCYDTNNISYTGHTQSSGTFGNGLNTLGVMDGVMLSSGNLTNAPGPNTITNAGNALNTAGDPDLEIIANTTLVYDASILEFDFEPTTDTIRFKYVFASEEYCDYSNSNYNDAFGFFLSGPGINGPFSNNAINIAALPTGQAVSINNVNHINNPAYYISNTIPATNTGFRCTGNPLGTQPGISELEFDGFTVLLEAVAVVQPCQTYHIKLAVGDVYDRHFDSAVFLASNSFTSGEQVIAEFNNPTTNLPSGSEGCDDAYLEFCRLDADDTSNPLDITYSIDASSTATPGVDFTALPTTITIPAGQNCIQVPMELIADDIIEGTETLRLTIDQSCSCSSNFVDFEINDQVPVELSLTSDQTLCPGESVTLEAIASNGTGTITYLWNTGETSSSIQVSPSTSDLYSVTVTDACSQENIDSVQVLIETPPTAFLDGDGVLCTGQNGSVPINIDLTGSGPWEVSYTLDGVEQTLITTSNDQYVLNVSEVGTYNLISVTDLDNTCAGSVSGSSIITETSVDFSLGITDLSCFDDQSGEIDVLVNTGSSPFEYDWSVAGVLGNNPTGLDAGGYTVTVTDANGCISSASTVLSQPNAIQIDITDIVEINCFEPIASAIASASGGTGQTYTIDWSNGDAGNQFNSVVPGDFEVSVTDENNCLQTAELSIAIDTAGIATVNADDHTLTCAINSLNITGIQTDVPTNTLDFAWTTSDGQIVSGATSLTPLVDAPGTYTVQITNNSNGCIEDEEVIVGENVVSPQVDAGLGDTLTCAIQDLTLDGSESDSGMGYSLDWSTSNGNIVSGSNTTTPLIDAPGTYQLVVTDLSNGCSSSANVDVQENTVDPTVGISTSIDELTCIETSATLTGSVSGTGPDYTYNWSGTGGVLILSGQGTISALVGSSGVYSLEVIDNGNGCSSIESIEIFEDVTIPAVEALSNDILDCVTNTVDLTSTVSGSGTTFSYQWFDTNNQAISGATNPTTTVQSIGTYTLEVVDNDNGCVNSNTVEVLEDMVLPEVSLAVSEVLSCALTEVDITTSVSQVDTATYSWVDASGQPIVGESYSELSVTAPGTYQVTVENIENGCVTTDEIIVEQDITLPDVIIADVDELNCVETTVEIDATASSNGPNFTYTWTTVDGNILSGSDQLNPAVDETGTYFLDILNNENGCVSSSMVFVDENVSLPIAQIQAEGILNCEDVLLTLDGGASSSGALFEYIWTTADGNLVGETNQVQAEVDQSGTYVLTVNNIENGCLSTAEVFVDSNTDAPTAVIDNAALLTCTQVSIELNGALSSGSSLDFRWIDVSNGTELGQAETVLVSEPGVYELEVTDGENGCIDVEEVLIEQNIIVPTVSIDSIELLTCVVNEVQVVATSETNSNQAEYAWSTNNGNITGNLDEIYTTVSMVGTYQLTVMDPFNGCSTVVSAVVAEDVNYPEIDILPTTVITCVDSTANLQVEVIDGNPSYEFEWEAISGNITGAVNLPTVLATMAGEYAVEVTDPSNGCVSQSNILVEEDFEAPLSVASSDDVLTCDLEQVWIHGIGSDQGADFTYLWYDENNNPISGANSIILAVSEPGFYTFEVLDGSNGCVSNAVVEVIQNIESPDFSLSVPEELTCFETEVSILSTVYSNAAVSYNWMTAGSNQTIGVGADLIVVEPGMYVLELEDVTTGCLAIQDIEVFQDVDFPQVELSVNGELTCLDTILDINADILGSDEFLELTWINPLGEVLPDPQVQMAVDYAGVYQLAVLNPINGCQTDVSIEVEENSIYPEVIASSPDQLDCNTDAVQILVELGLNEGEYEAFWMDPFGSPFQPAQVLSPTVDVEGMYAVIITDLSNNCSTVTEVLIESDYDQPLIDAGLDVVIPCYEESTSLSGTVIDETLEVELQWFTTSGLIIEGESTTHPEVAQEGVYTLSVIDLGNGCSSLDSVMVEKEQPFDIAVEGLDPVCYGDFGGLNIEVIDQNGPFLYSIDGGEQFTTTSHFAYLEAGDYEVVVYDIDGCPSLTEVIQIIEPIEVAVYTEEQVYLEQGNPYFVNSYTNYPLDQIESITWSPADGLSCTDCLNPTFDGMQSMSYQVEIITSSGCEARATIEFIVDKTVDIYVPNVFTPNGGGNNSVAIVFANPTSVKEIDKFCIFDRWGELVFSNEKFPPNDPAHGWDGSFNGKPFNSGVFAYYLEVVLADGRKELIKGDITILGQ